MTTVLDTPTSPRMSRRATPQTASPPRRAARHPPIRVEAAGNSVRGARHRRNEDALLMELPLVVVADGVGGAPGGHLAARCAVQAIGGAARGEASAAVRLLEAFAQADREVCEAASEHDLPGMATTATAALLDGDDLLVSHVGDSRAYRVRSGRLECLTQDHRLVAELERRGMITAAEARTHRWRSMIVRALGLGTPLSPSLRVERFEHGDLYLLCTDGLTEVLNDERIAAELLAGGHLVATASRLVTAARAAGATDDVTVALIRSH